MNELIKTFNDNETHIEIDAVNQFENGSTKDRSVYSYTVILLQNETGEQICSVSIDKFDKDDIEFVKKYFNLARFNWKNKMR